MTLPDRQFISRFTPSRTKPEVLEAIFVQREMLLRQIVERIQESGRTGDKHHQLLIGPRGSGKTHLVTLAVHRLQQHQETPVQLRIAWLNEDESSISYVDFLLRVLRALHARYPEEFCDPDYETLNRLETAQSGAHVESLILEQLGARTALIVVENVDELFAGLGEEGQLRLRGFLQQHSKFTILGTAQQLFEGVQSRNLPFYGFFQILHLKPLSVDEAVALLTRIAEVQQDEELKQFLATPHGRARVRAIHHLSGGNHRVYIILSEFITKKSLDDLVLMFERMLDELTPYYQERLRWLSAQQRRIVELLCRHAAPLAVNEIAQRLPAVTEQTVSSQLTDLRSKGYVVSQKVGRNSLYELSEPLMRLSNEVKQNQGKPIRLIVEFLKTWYECDGLVQLLNQIPANDIRTREYLVQAIQEIINRIPSTHNESLLKEIVRLIEKVPSRQLTLDECQRGRRLATELLEVDHSVTAIFAFAVFAILVGEAEEALSFAERYLAKTSIDYWFVRANCLSALGRSTEAMKSCDEALKIEADHPAVWEIRGKTLLTLGKYEEGIADLKRSLELDGKRADAAMQISITLFDLGKWEEGFFFLSSALNNKDAIESEIVRLLGRVMEDIRLKSADSTKQSDCARQLVSLCIRSGWIGILAAHLFTSVRQIDVTKSSSSSIDQWRDLWKAIASEQDELSIAFQMFEVALEYQRSEPKDQRILLQLPIELRSILHKIFEIEDSIT